jgi:hypothetical protein
MPLGSGGGAFNGGTITSPLTVNPSTDPAIAALYVKEAAGETSPGLEVDNSAAGTLFAVYPHGDTEISPDSAATVLKLFSGGGDALETTDTFSVVQFAIDSTGMPVSKRGFQTTAITSGALPTVSPSSGVAFQPNATRDAFLFAPFTLTTAAGTCKVELSPDNVTFSTLATLAPGVNGAVAAVMIQVPNGWRVKLTVTNATLGTGTVW